MNPLSNRLPAFVLACWLCAVCCVASAEARSWAVAIASGGMVILTEDGHAVSFKDPVNLKRPVRISGAEDIVAADRKPPLSIALRRNGRVLIWREDCRAKTDIDVDCTFSTASEMQGVTDVKAVSQGDGFSLALTRDGSLWGWGDDTYGQVSGRQGSPSSRRIVRRPMRIPLPAPAQSISAGWRHSLALLEDGRVVTWGTPPHHSLGVGQRIGGGGTFTATVVEGLPSVRQVAARELSYALSSDGRVWSWGIFDNTVHRFGQEHAVENPGEIQFAEIGTGHGYAVGRDAYDNVFVWGALASRDLARSGLDMVFSATPVRVEGLPAVKSISVGEGGVAALDVDGNVWAWGKIWFGPTLRKLEID